MANRAAAPADVRDRNTVLLDRYMTEVWNNGNYAVAHELVSPEMVIHGAGGQEVKQGPDGVAALVSAWRTAFPDGRMIVHHVLAEGDLVVDRMTWEGTQTGEFYGIPASNQRVRCTSIGMDRIVDGVFTEGWGELDMLGMMQQLGAFPAFLPPTSGGWDDTAGEPADAAVPDRRTAVSTALRFLAAYHAADKSALRDVVDEPRWVDHNPTTGAGGLAAGVRFVQSLRAAVPDLVVVPDEEHVVVDGNAVSVRWTATGTHSGAPLWGAAVSGAKVMWTGSDILRLSGGRCRERWVSADLLSLAKQIGAVP